MAMIDFSEAERHELKTHTLVTGDDGTVVLKRLLFDCNFSCCHRPG